MLQLILNKFTVLDIGEYTKNDSELSDISICFISTSSIVYVKCFKWEKVLSFYFMISTLNVCRASLYLSISLETTDTIETFSKQALVDSGATGIFINCSFVEKHCFNSCKLLRPILIYNINSALNKDS